jgi:hypothetical protein
MWAKCGKLGPWDGVPVQGGILAEENCEKERWGKLCKKCKIIKYI